jgi:type II secretory pathway component GspD/PulD (secretin)
MRQFIRASRRTSAPPRIHSSAFAIAAVTALALFFDIALSAAVETRQNWFARPFKYVIINQEVRGILTELGRNIGVPVILTDKVAGRVRGEFAERTRREADRQTAGEFLNRLAETNGLTWYFDGSILYVSADQEFSTQVIEVGTLSHKAIVTELQRLSLMDSRFSVRSAGDAGLISVSGPPAFIAIVRQVVDKLRPPPAVAGDDPRVRVFRGGAPAEVVRAAAHGDTTQPQHDVAPRQNDTARSAEVGAAARGRAGKR